MSKTISAYIIEDEVNSRMLLKDILGIYAGHVELIGESDNLEQAEQDLYQLKVDILFCDIKVKGRSSIPFLENFLNPTFQVIFTTAYSDFAVNAFRLDAIDYLLKPITPPRVLAALDRLKSRIGDTKQPHPIESYKTLKKLMITEAGEINFVDLEDIIYLKADKMYCEVHTRNGQKLISSKGLAHYESTLDRSEFYRIHHSYIVNLRHVQGFDSRSLKIDLTSNIQLNVSKRKKSDFIRNLESISFS